jgi:hypothetical protein
LRKFVKSKIVWVLSSIKNSRFQEFCFYEQEFQISYLSDVTATFYGNDGSVVGDSKILVWTTEIFVK